MVDDVLGSFDFLLGHLQDGTGVGDYPLASGVLGWGHPYGVSYGGMTGGEDITMTIGADGDWELPIGAVVMIGLGYTLLGYDSLLKGLGKLEINADLMKADLDANWELLAEPIQTVMRRYGVQGAYEKLKDFTRGRDVGAPELRAFLATLGLPEDTRRRLEALTPAAYTGLAEALARDA